MANENTNTNEQNEFKELTLKFGKGCVQDSFTAKDGKEYTPILIPNSDPADKRPWATFIVPANHVHPDKFGNGMWTKVPAEGSTTIRRSVKVGVDENGKNIWSEEKTKVTNKELKSMVEFYKERPREQEKQEEKDELPFKEDMKDSVKKVESKKEEKTPKEPKASKSSAKKPSLKAKVNALTKEVAKEKAQALEEKTLKPKEMAI